MSEVPIPVRLESLAEGGYLAICEAIQGCHAEGETVAEALENLEEVARTLLDLQREDGLPSDEMFQSVEAGTLIRAYLRDNTP